MMQQMEKDSKGGVDPRPVPSAGDPRPVPSAGDPRPVPSAGDPRPRSSTGDPRPGSNSIWRFFSAVWKAPWRNRKRQVNAERAAERLAALNRVGSALAQELDEPRLLHLIAET